MQIPNIKTDSQSRSQLRKFQYFGGEPKNNNLTASSIDHHRNSIQQRIANLQSKLAKKFNPQLQLSAIPQNLSENYVNARRIYQYAGISSQPQNYIPPSSQTHQAPPQIDSKPQPVISHSKQSSTQKNTYNYLANFQNNADQVALRQKSKFSSVYDQKNYRQSKIQSRDRLKAALQKNEDKFPITTTAQKQSIDAYKQRQIGKKIKNVLEPKNQNIRQEQERKYQSTQKFQSKRPIFQYQFEQPYKLTQTIPSSNHILHSRYFQDLNQLNNNITALKNYTIGSKPIQNYRDSTAVQSRTISYDTGVNLAKQNQNNELYQMMKNIMIGQERLQKELMMLKNNKSQQDKPYFAKDYGAKNSLETLKPKQTQREKSFSIAEIKKANLSVSRAVSPRPVVNQQRNLQNLDPNLSRSPQTNHKNSKSPRLQKSKSPIENKPNNQKQQISGIRRKRANSAVINKKQPGKIQKNKQHFNELYKQAQLNKRLSEINSRITVSKGAISSVWQKIKQSIKRAEQQDVQTSVIYHENNRWVNDHLVSKIELQKKLKNDLVKKVYDMCENKCLFK